MMGTITTVTIMANMNLVVMNMAHTIMATVWSGKT
jgi:hypothetical protein